MQYPTGLTQAATDAPYTITHDDGEAEVDVDQTTGGGQWVSVGTFAFTKNGDHSVQLGVSETGTVAADAVMLVRDNTADVDAEAKDITYGYDPNGNLTSIADTSTGAQVDAYEIDYTGLNQVQTVEELAGGSAVNTTEFTYDANGNPLTTVHDDQHAEFAYTVRDLVDQVTNANDASDPDPKVTGYTYTPNGWTATEDRANGNTVTYDYYLDGLLKHQLETRSDGTTVSEHTVAWDGNGNRTQDVSKTMDADTPGTYLNRTHNYTYDPRDRIAGVTKTDTVAGVTLATESYAYDAASNVISQTVDGGTTSYVYDRNRLLTATTDGVTATYNYDPFGRLNAFTAGGEVIESYTYDGFDRIAEHTSLDESGGTETTSYTYDPLDRTASRTDAAGETTDYSYLGLSGEVLNEEIAGEVQRSYQYSPWGKRLSQVTHNGDGSTEDGYYGYNAHTDVETVTGESGNPISTYGYTAYGNDDDAEFTGIDAPDAGTPGDEPYNSYRYNAKRWDSGTGNYDMGFRDYDPGINRFLSRDMYTGALADLNLQTSPWTNNRYAFTGGNPITFIEHDGHAIICGEGCDSPAWYPVTDPGTGEVTFEPQSVNDSVADVGGDVSDGPTGSACFARLDCVSGYSNQAIGASAGFLIRTRDVRAEAGRTLSGGEDLATRRAAAHQMNSLRNHPLLQRLGELGKNPIVRTVGKASLVSGVGLSLATDLSDGYSIGQAAARAGITVGSAVAGAGGGAAIGGLCGPAAVVCSPVLEVIGGIVGGVTGKNIGDLLYEPAPPDDIVLPGVPGQESYDPLV